eukprot:5128093-Pleurochrysis_carterae.AAC.1
MTTLVPLHALMLSTKECNTNQAVATINDRLQWRKKLSGIGICALSSMLEGAHKTDTAKA